MADDMLTPAERYPFPDPGPADPTAYIGKRFNDGKMTIDAWAEDAKAQIDRFVAEYKANAAKGDTPMDDSGVTYGEMYPLRMEAGEWDEQARSEGIC